MSQRICFLKAFLLGIGALNALPLTALANVTVLQGEGSVRDADSPNDGVLFKIAYTHTHSNGKAISTQIRQTDLTGQLLVDENTTYDSQGRFQLYTMTQKQTGDSARVEVKGDTVVMSHTEDGKTSTHTEPKTDDTNAPGSLMAYMSAFTDALRAGQLVPVRLAVAERGMLLRFNIARGHERCSSLGGDLCVNLALNNFILKKMVKPVLMSFQKTPQGFRPLSIETPALVRKRKGNALEKFTARIDYQKLN